VWPFDCQRTFRRITPIFSVKDETKLASACSLHHTHCLTYSSTLKMEATYFFETSVAFQRRRLSERAPKCERPEALEFPASCCSQVSEKWHQREARYLCSSGYVTPHILYRVVSFSARGSADASVCYGMLSNS
jgi:hypothetical protein